MTNAALFFLGFAALMWFLLRPPPRCKGCGETLPSRYPFDRCLSCRMPTHGTPDADRLLHEMFD